MCGITACFQFREEVKKFGIPFYLSLLYQQCGNKTGDYFGVGTNPEFIRQSRLYVCIDPFVSQSLLFINLIGGNYSIC
jgi:hypothetical protein